MTERLTKVNWLDHGLKVLASTGPSGLKADPLAKSLKVSRGSFYWHFRDITEFHAELLARWREHTTDRIIDAVDQQSAQSGRLRHLMRMAMTSDDALERGVRTWAAQNAEAAKAIASVDKARLKYLTSLFQLSGLADKQASSRATFVYWAYIGRVMLPDSPSSLSVDEIHSIADLFQHRDCKD